MTRTKPAEPLTRELRQQARDQGVEDWETLSREELSQAVQGHTHGEEPAPPDEDAGTESPEEAEEAVPTATKRTRSRTTKATTSKAKPATAKKTATKATPTKRASSTTAKAKVKAAPRPVSTGPNPFTPGTKLHLITEQLIKGGKRSDLVKALRGKLDFHPRARGGPDFDQDEETDRRLKIVGYLLKQKFGWTYSLEPDSNGKYGKNSYIKCTPPKGK